MIVSHPKYLLHIFFGILIIICPAVTSSQDSVLINSYQAPDIRTVPDSVTERLKKEKEFLYANDPSYWKEQERKVERSAFEKFLDNLARSAFLKWFVYLLVAAVILFALYQVVVVNNFFAPSKRKRKQLSEAGEMEAYSAESIDEKIRQAVQNGEYRVAIRFMYLKTLNILSEKQLIRLHSKSTNTDYIHQMQKQQSGQDFKTLTHIYEYVWYGEFQPSENQFRVIEVNFNRFISKQ